MVEHYTGQEMKEVLQTPPTEIIGQEVTVQVSTGWEITVI